MTLEDVRRLIASGLEYDPSYSVDDVLKEVREHTAELMYRDRSLVVWNLIERPRSKCFHIWIAAGDLEEIINEIYPALVERARELGCDQMSYVGRRGWIRVLKDKGFKEVATVAVKELCYE